MENREEDFADKIPVGQTACGKVTKELILVKVFHIIVTRNDKELQEEMMKLFLSEDGKQSRMEGLVRAIEKCFLRNMTEENILMLYNVGVKIKSELMKKTCFEIIKKNKKVIWPSQEDFENSFKEFPELMYKLLTDE